MGQCFLVEISAAHSYFSFVLHIVISSHSLNAKEAPLLLCHDPFLYTFPIPSVLPNHTPLLRPLEYSGSLLESSDISAGQRFRGQVVQLFLSGEEELKAQRNEVTSLLTPTPLIFLLNKSLSRKSIWWLVSELNFFLRYILLTFFMFCLFYLCPFPTFSGKENSFSLSGSGSISSLEALFPRALLLPIAEF